MKRFAGWSMLLLVAGSTVAACSGGDATIATIPPGSVDGGGSDGATNGDALATTDGAASGDANGGANDGGPGGGLAVCGPNGTNQCSAPLQCDPVLGCVDCTSSANCPAAAKVPRGRLRGVHLERRLRYRHDARVLGKRPRVPSGVHGRRLPGQGTHLRRRERAVRRLQDEPGLLRRQPRVRHGDEGLCRVQRQRRLRSRKPAVLSRGSHLRSMPREQRLRIGCAGLRHGKLHVPRGVHDQRPVPCHGTEVQRRDFDVRAVRRQRRLRRGRADLQLRGLVRSVPREHRLPLDAALLR
jgi:hypothetical protein